MNAIDIQLRASTDQQMATVRERLRQMDPLTIDVLRQEISSRIDLANKRGDVMGAIIGNLAFIAFSDALCNLE